MLSICMYMYIYRGVYIAECIYNTYNDIHVQFYMVYRLLYKQLLLVYYISYYIGVQL